LLNAGNATAANGYESYKPMVANKSATKARILRSVKHGEKSRIMRLNRGETPSHSNNPTLNLVGELSNKNEPQSRTNKEAEKPGSIRLITETESHEDEQSKKENRLTFSFAAGAASRMTASNTDHSTFFKEIEAELKSSEANPSTLDEAKQFLNLKNSVILKLKSYVNSLPTSGASADQQNMVDYLKYENERLENKLLLIQTELGVEKTRSEQIKEAFNEQKKQMSKLNDLNRELEIAARNALKKENQSWQRILDDMKATHSKEILRKQDEVAKLHDLLAAWVFRYMEIQEAKNIAPTHAEKLLYEAFKRREYPARQLIEKALASSKSVHQLNTSQSQQIQFSTPTKKLTTVATSPKLNTSLNVSVSATELKKRPSKYYFGNFLKI